MCPKKIVAMSLVFLSLFVNYSNAQQTKEVTFTGRVIDTEGKPIAGVKVTAYEMVSDGIAGNILLHQVGEVTTKGDGAFFFTTQPKPARGTFLDGHVVATKQDLVLGWVVWTMRADAESNIELGEPETLEGMIVDEKGKPVIGAEVRANLYRRVETAEGEEKRQWLPGIAPLHELGTQTDGQGKFLFSNLPANLAVDLLVTAADKATTYTYQSALWEPAFKAGQTDIKVTVPKEARITGKILDPDTGKGIAKAKFAVVDSSGLFFYRFVYTSGKDGSFNIGGLQSGEYLIRGDALSNTNVTVKSGKTTKVTVRANKSSGLRRIRGVVRDEKGELVSNAIVSTRLGMSENTITNTEGRFTLKCKPKNTLRPREDTTYLIVRHKERNLAATVEFDDDNAETLDIRLTPGVIFSGKVIDIEGKGIPDADLFVTFRVSHLGIGGREVTNIDAQGNYEIRAVPSGHKFSVSASAEGYGEQYVQAHTAEAVDGRIELDPLVLAIANLSISGVALDVDDKPVADARISCYGEGQPARRTQTNEDGRFTLKKVCAGRIVIRAQKGGQTRLRGYLETEGGATDIRIVVAELDASGRPVPKQPPSLVGKSLPDLNSISTDFIPEQVKGKMILVCFWDMEQRPSRNCIIELTKRAKELEEKGVAIIAIQASEINENKLDEWVKKYNIPFTVGMVQSDVEKTKFTWDVRLLPWLILTDKQHAVQAEGFSINELDERIATLREK